MSKLIDKLRYEGNFDIDVDAKRNLLVIIYIDKKRFSFDVILSNKLE